MYAHQFCGKVIGNLNTSQEAIIETQELRHQNPTHLSLGHPVDAQQLTEVRQQLEYHNECECLNHVLNSLTLPFLKMLRPVDY